MSVWRGLLLLAVLLLFGTGCSQRVVIDSIPQGADVRIDGVHVGTTPVSQRLDASSWWLQGTAVEISRPGYRTVSGPLDWRYDGRHWWFLALAWFPPSQLIHAHPRLHRQPLDRYLVILDEDLGEGVDERERIYGKLDPRVDDDPASETSTAGSDTVDTPVDRPRHGVGSKGRRP